MQAAEDLLCDPVDSALLWFKADSAKVVEDFVAADPYVKNGLVTSWRVRPWMTVAATQADNPIYPGGAQ